MQIYPLVLQVSITAWVGLNHITHDWTEQCTCYPLHFFGLIPETTAGTVANLETQDMQSVLVERVKVLEVSGLGAVRWALPSRALPSPVLPSRALRPAPSRCALFCSSESLGKVCVRCEESAECVFMLNFMCLKNILSFRFVIKLMFP